jgi:electron transfer flavoprotein beta subunit
MAEPIVNIVVLVCDGIFGRKPVYIDDDAELYEKNLYYVCNPDDQHAIDLAMAVRNDVGDARVTAISVGNERAADLARKSLLIGADRGIWGNCGNAVPETGYDIGFVLADIIERHCRPFDLLLMGSCSPDFRFGIVGPALARRFCMNYFDNVSHIETIDGRKYRERPSITFHKIMEKGDRLVCESPAPLVIGVSGSGKGLGGVRSGDLMTNIRKEIEVVQVGETFDGPGMRERRKLTGIAFQGYLEPRPRPKKIPVPDSSLSPMDRLKKITAGNTPGKATNIVEGDPERVAAEFVKCVSVAGK